MAPPIWWPNPALSRQARIRGFMRKHRIPNVRELHRRSTRDIGWFWDAVARDLDIEWSRPYRRVLDTHRGIPWARWFTGGRINLVHNCVDRHAAGARRNQAALIWEGEEGIVRTWTYRDLQGEVNRCANALRALGVGPGDTVGIYMPYTLESAAAALACAKTGAIYTPIFSGFGPEAAAARLSDAGAKVLFTADGFYRRGREVPLKPQADEAAHRAGVEKRVVLRRTGSPVPWEEGRDQWWHEFVSGQSRVCATRPVDSEHPFLLIHTSGTTGRPKGAVHVHGGFLVKIMSEVAYSFDLRPGADTLFWLTEMGWIMAPWELVGGLGLGGTVLLYDGAPDHPDPARLWRMVEDHGVTILGLSPSAVRGLMRQGDQWVKKHDLRSLRILGSTGEPWNPVPYRWYFEKIGGKRCPIINISGGTEVGACFLAPLPIQPLHPCSLGGPAPGMDLEVYDENGKPVRGKTGELVCRQPWPGMTRGLWKDPQRYLETYWSRWPNTWLHGDWASIQGDQWYLHGRSDDTLKIAGKRVGPAEIESALVSHPRVAEAAAIGVPHEVKGEAIVCFAVPKGNPPPDPAQLRDHVAQAMGKALKPEAVHLVTQLPKTRNAKIVRRAIRAVYLGTEMGSVETLENPEALEEVRRMAAGARP
ncbi:MAG: AMP-binding protein [Euryarchaeota archaeon]|nr:AMP-binding protein [Euryarchaeota archaeon]